MIISPKLLPTTDYVTNILLCAHHQKELLSALVAMDELMGSNEINMRIAAMVSWWMSKTMIHKQKNQYTDSAFLFPANWNNRRQQLSCWWPYGEAFDCYSTPYFRLVVVSRCTLFIFFYIVLKIYCINFLRQKGWQKQGRDLLLIPSDNFGHWTIAGHER